MASEQREPLPNLSGKWRIVELPDLTEDYLSLSKDPHVRLSQKRKSIEGDYEFGAQSGTIDGELFEEKDGSLSIRFSFEGWDEDNQENGYGEGAYDGKGETLVGKMHYHHGDTYRFVWKRANRTSRKHELK